MKQLTAIFAFLGWGLSLLAQPSLLQSGPMVGYCEMREAMIWVQSKEEAEISIQYHASDAPDAKVTTAPYKTQKASAYAAHIVLEPLEPGKTYIYRVLINGQALDFPYPTLFQTPPNWLYRGDPPSMKIALGSCAYINDAPYDRPGTPYGGEYEIFEAMHRYRPDLMLWLGDNVYYREADWYSRTGMIYRNTHTRSLPQMQALLASTANYAIWDDHDFGPNDSDMSFGRKQTAQEVFQLFWANPSYGLSEGKGITSTFEWGDAQFFLVDDRYFRTPNNKQTETRTILGKEQLEWLINALISSKSKFKFVCIGGQVVNDAALFENFARIAPEERTFLLESIVKEKIRNVIFLSGDRHHSELSKMEKDGITIYDFTVSPLTSGSHDASQEPNTLRVQGSHVGIRNYGTIETSGPSKERKLKLALFDSQGKALYSYEISPQ